MSVSKHPFGRGEDTIVDKSIRDALQLSPDDFQLKNTDGVNGEVLSHAAIKV